MVWRGRQYQVVIQKKVRDALGIEAGQDGSDYSLSRSGSSRQFVIHPDSWHHGRKAMEAVVYQPIGLIHSPFEGVNGMPIQPSGALGVVGWVEIEPAYAEGLQDLAGFSHIILIYHFHEAGEAKLLVTPFLGKTARGVFATRAPVRPNPIGLSIVELIGMEGTKLEIRNVDVLNGTPLLDIKPYIPQMEVIEDVRTGWLSSNVDEIRRTRADDRFEPKS
jgi:tRNA-Thr(GGU) m(6)t(6)A37 methyltransferase TsaA